MEWVAFNAIAQHADFGRRYTARTNHLQRSFEDTALKQRASAWCWPRSVRSAFRPA